MSVLNPIIEQGFEKVVFFNNPSLDLTAIIAVHSTVLGPGLGGCRFKSYENIDSALKDVLRLAEGMSYKSSLAGLNLGGGKSVIIQSEKSIKNRNETFKVFAKWVESLKGSYVTAEDMGTSLQDVKIMSDFTSYISGSDPEKGGGGDPSPFTARGVFLGMKACLEEAYGNESVRNKVIAIQGVGSVGYYLAEILLSEGAIVKVADLNKVALDKAKSLGAEIVSPDHILSTECDIFAPCAAGAILNKDSIGNLNCKIVAGAANNQLEKVSDENLLLEKGIMYAPDFAINSGGVIMCADELEEGGFNLSRVNGRVDKIRETVSRVIKDSKSKNLLVSEVAISLAKERIQKAKAAIS